MCIRLARRSIGPISFISLAALLMGLTAAHARPPASASSVTDARLTRAAREPQNWLIDGGSYSGWHYSALTQIDLRTIADLKPAWFFELDTYRGQEAEPVVIDGVMYVSTAWSKVYALDAATGKRLWSFDPQVAGEIGAKSCCDVVNRGVAVYKGRVYLAALDGRLIALDARRGTLVWSTQTIDPRQPHVITAAPRIAKGKVIIGNAGGEFNARGYVSAYDADTGKLVWRFYTVPGDPAGPGDGAASDDVLTRVALPTWHGNWFEHGGGGTVWTNVVYDPELDQLYFGTGNGSPWNRRFRSADQGDNLFLCSIVAVDPDTGRYLWHYQLNPGESWDFDAGMPMVLADLNVGGRIRKALMQAPKNGFFYVLDRTNGQLISAQPFVPGITWASHIDPETGRPMQSDAARRPEGPFLLSPPPNGAHNWHPMAFSPQTGWVYFSALEGAMTILRETQYEKLPGPVDNIGETMRGGPAPKRYLLAWDPVANRQAWRADQPAGAPGGGVLATGGGLLFQGNGTITGQLTAWRADNGQQVWSHRLPNAVLQAPVTYRLNGAQYVAVVSGARGGGSAAAGPHAFLRQSGRVVAFKLGGTAILPADPAAAGPANPSEERWPSSVILRGE